MRQDHYLSEDGWTPSQKEHFERMRITVCVLCATTARSVKEIAMYIGIYQTHKIVRELHEDGYLTRMHRKKTGETVYKLNPTALHKDAFFPKG